MIDYYITDFDLSQVGAYPCYVTGYLIYMDVVVDIHYDMLLSHQIGLELVSRTAEYCKFGKCFYKKLSHSTDLREQEFFLDIATCMFIPLLAYFSQMEFFMHVFHV